MNKDYIVRKRNSLVVNSRYDLSLEEQRVVLILCSMVRKDDEDFKAYAFKIKDFLRLIGVKDTRKYIELPKIVDGLLSKPFEIRDGNRVTKLNWLAEATWIENEGVIVLKFSPTLKPYMLKLNEFYTSYRLENILNLKSKYSIRMYELLKCNEYRKRDVNFELEELKRMLGVGEDEYPLYGNFKQRVLISSQKEVGEKTDLSFSFSELKTGRKVTGVSFKISSNISKQSNIEKEKKFQIEQVELTGYQMRQEIYEFSQRKISLDDAETLLSAAGGDVEEVKRCYTLAKKQSNIRNLTGWMLSAIENSYYAKEHKGSTFNNFDGRGDNYLSNIHKLESLKYKMERGEIARTEYDTKVTQLLGS